MTRISIDPITRIEGHLRIDCEVDGGVVTNAWSSGQMWRGIETILQGRDPRDAWIFTQRICGVCTTVHAIVSVRAVENALDLEVPLNAQYIRNMIIAAHAVHDHIVHFYQLAALDWVDIVSALDADPAATAKLGASLSDYSRNGVPELRAIQDKLKSFVGSGQLGIFASGYWGHPAMKLPPEVNLLAAAHYLQALEVQREANKIVTILGSKTPHIQNLAVGGVANAINLESQSTLTLERLFAIKSQIDALGEFVHEAMLPDVAAVGALYADWTTYGAGVTNYLSVPDMPLDGRGTQCELPGGYIPGGDLGAFQPITGLADDAFRDGVKEAVKHSWYRYEGGDGARHPWEGQTNPSYSDFEDDGKYSWIKAPTFNGERAQVGPLANVLAMYAAGHESTKRHLERVLSIAGAVAGSPIPLADLKRIVESMSRAAADAGVAIVAGDTKVVERGQADGLFINTTGVGVVPDGVTLSGDRARPGDRILLSGTIGDHGVAIMSRRSGLEFHTEIESDSAALHDLVRVMLAAAPGVGMCLREADVPVAPEVAAACELLGLDPLYVANEGKLVGICPAEEAKALLAAMRGHPLGRRAAVIGEVEADAHHFVRMQTRFGGSRVVDWLSGEQLPRIC